MLHSYYNEVVYSWLLLFLSTNNKTTPLHFLHKTETTPTNVALQTLPKDQQELSFLSTAPGPLVRTSCNPLPLPYLHPSTVLPAICRRPVAKFGTHNEARSCSATMQIVTVRTKQNRFCVFFVFFLPHCFFCSATYFHIAHFFNGNRPQKHSLLTSFFIWSC